MVLLSLAGIIICYTDYSYSGNYGIKSLVYSPPGAGRVDKYVNNYTVLCWLRLHNMASNKAASIDATASAL